MDVLSHRMVSNIISQVSYTTWTVVLNLEVIFSVAIASYREGKAVCAFFMLLVPAEDESNELLWKSYL